MKPGDLHRLPIGNGNDSIVCRVDSVDGNEVLLVDAQGGVYLITVLPPESPQHQRPFRDGWKLRARARTPLLTSVH